MVFVVCLATGIGVKVCCAVHNMLETQSTPPTLECGVSGCEHRILTPMFLATPSPRLRSGLAGVGVPHYKIVAACKENNR